MTYRNAWKFHNSPVLLHCSKTLVMSVILIDMSFEVERFASTPSVEELNTLKKSKFLLLVNHYYLSATSSMPKSQIKQTIVTHLVDERLFLCQRSRKRMCEVRGV